MRFCFFGAYDPSYPRHAVIRQGLRMNGAEVRECQVTPKFKFWLRYPLLVLNYLKFCALDCAPKGQSLRSAHFSGQSKASSADFLFVPEFRQKDVPLAKLFALLSSKRLIFDPLASRFETKIIDWRRKPPDSLASWWNFKIDLWSFRWADLVLADTRAHKNYYCQKYGLGPDKVEVLPLGYDDHFFKPLDRDSPQTARGQSPLSRFTVLFFGSFLPLHGVEIILEAARVVKQEDPSILFRFIGSGQTFPKVKAKASAYGLSNLEFQGWMPQFRLLQEINSAHICLGIFGKTIKAGRVVPHKIFQAMGMRKAVITRRTSASEEFFLHRENIFFCDDPLPESLARAVLELKKDESLRIRIAQNGYQLVSEKFSCKATGSGLMEILRKRYPG